MTAIADSRAFFVGSVPVATAEEAFRACAGAVGDHVFALPDGETGARRWWIGALGEATYSRHPAIEKVQLDHPFSNWVGAYKLKDGITSIDLRGYLPYSDATISSYGVFRRLRDDGVIPQGVRIQVAFPTPHAATGGFFADHADWDLLWPAWSDAVRAELDRILKVVPAADLAVQLDYCTEFVDIYGDLAKAWPYQWDIPGEEKFRILTSRDYIGPLTGALGEQVALGYHICAGTYPRQPVLPLDDMTPVVAVANTLVKATPRRVDFVHMPVMASASDGFFEPLRALEIGPAKPILGMEAGDGPGSLRRRIHSALKSLPDFAVAHFCGYGRDSDESFPALLETLRQGAMELTR